MPPIDRRAIHERDQGLCGFCQEPVQFEKMHLDHIEPRGLGGPTEPANLRVAHPRCNIAAGHRVRAARRERGLPAGTAVLFVRTLDAETKAKIERAAQEEDLRVAQLLRRIIREWLAARQGHQ